MSAEDDSFCLITNINLAATAIIGYNKMEVLNKNMMIAMPWMYA